MVIVVDLQAQRIHVYRNGVRIGLSPVSSGRSGFETPPGVYTILQKRRTHFSNLYDGAPMPYMQRLTWSGVALHAGTLPGYPASHGCIRLPHEFAEQLYGITAQGMTVIVSDSGPSPSLVQPLSLHSAKSTAASTLSGSAASTESAQPPVTLVWSTSERELVVLRNGVIVERGSLALRGKPRSGTRAWMLLGWPASGAQRTEEDMREEDVREEGMRKEGMGRWIEVPLAADMTPALPILRADLDVDPGFAEHVRAWLRPGTTVVMTDQPLQVPNDTPRAVFDAQSKP